ALASAMRGTLVYDTRAVVDVESAQAAGLQVERLGRPSPSVGADQPAATASPVREPASSSASES
ncbi:MAG: hypothetical protein Q7S35_02540, partial [Candidatus Limnocylindrales bacterium]|nr:hypothetical protein [Candidatus Limnocylindrales bacterium]